jgi:hypothetical protein
MFSWRRMFTDLGWAMAMTDPMCYSYYLASRVDSTSGDRARDISAPKVVFGRAAYENRARPAISNVDPRG